jgi:hypothetical protein
MYYYNDKMNEDIASEFAAPEIRSQCDMQCTFHKLLIYSQCYGILGKKKVIGLRGQQLSAGMSEVFKKR